MNNPEKQLNPPQPIEAFVSAINRHSTEDFLTTLGESVAITDEGQTYRGIEEARTWCDEKYVAAMIILEMIDVSKPGNETIVDFEIDGNFDKSGLPDPLVMDFHFAIENGKIVGLSIRLHGD